MKAKKFLETAYDIAHEEFKGKLKLIVEYDGQQEATATRTIIGKDEET